MQTDKHGWELFSSVFVIVKIRFNYLKIRKTMADFIEESVESNEITGLVCGVVKDGKLAWKKLMAILI